jgi:hypothetical protein
VTGRVQAGEIERGGSAKQLGDGVAIAGVEAIVGRSSVRVVAWNDRAAAAGGVDSRSLYAERFWLPILGPSTLWLLRHFTWCLERAPGGIDLSLAEVAHSVGLGDRLGRHAPFFRTVARAVDFAMIRIETCDTIAVRERLPLLSPRHLSRLPDALRLSHERWRHEVTFSEPAPKATGASLVATARR